VEYVCIAAHGSCVPGDVVAVPDGAAVSPEHFADPAAPEAIAAMTARGAVTDSPGGAGYGDAESPETPGAASSPPPVPVLAPPGAAERSN
jgi:hypothetical protein